MIYLLAKFTLLFALTTILGFVLGYWFSRRNIEDVTESFEDLRKANDRSDATQWDRLWMQLKSMPVPKETDLSTVYERIDNVSSDIAGLPKPQPVNLEPVETRLDSLGAMVGAIPVPLAPKPVDLTPVTKNLAVLEQRVNSLSRPEKIDLEPVDRRLTAIEVELAGLGKRLAERRPVAPASPEPASPDEPRILSAAIFGAKDDLQSISGVGPKMERILNQNGVFYFWQVAEWTKQDIDVIDERLDTFKGRIERDSWVSQAGQLKTRPGAAAMPAK